MEVKDIIIDFFIDTLSVGIGLFFVLSINLSKSLSKIWLFITEEELTRYPAIKRIKTSLISTDLEEIRKPKTEDKETKSESLNLDSSKKILIFSIII